MDNTKISAIIITKNEERNINDCLFSLKWADEIVVVDDYSIDRTEEICRSYHVCFCKNHFNSFSEQKSYAMSLAKYDWILEIDADERVSAEMRDTILKLDATAFEKYDCFEFRRLTRFWGKWIRHGAYYPDYKTRLYCRLRGKFKESTVHERFIPNGSSKRLPVDIMHKQDYDLMTFFNKTVRYADLSAHDYLSRGKTCHWHHITIRPLSAFFVRYFLKLGFIDGIQGFVISVMGGVSTYLKYMRLYELEKSSSGKITLRKP